MRANLTLEFQGELILPIHYNHIIQAVLLRWLNDESYSTFIHDTGYEHNNRRYKMYTFSKLNGKFRINKVNKSITFYDKVNLLVSSADDKFLNYIVNNIIMKDSFDIKGKEVTVTSIDSSYKNLNNKAKVYTKSPITVYSTFEKDDSKKTYYYRPQEGEFSQLIRNNLIYKYKALYDKEPDKDEFYIKPVDFSLLKKNVTKYKGFIIEGWSGEFYLEGSPELINIAYNAGLGSKNSQGYGCIELCR